MLKNDQQRGAFLTLKIGRQATNHNQTGFTLIELVLVLVLIGILGAVVAPRLMVSSQFEDRLQADKLVGLLRQAQLRAMNDPLAVADNTNLSRCGKVEITSQGFSIAKDCKSGLLSASDLTEQAQRGHFSGARDLTISATAALPITLQFGEPAVFTQTANKDKFLSEASSLGRPLIKSNGTLSRTAERLTIIIGGKKVHIESEGYIHAP